MEWAIIGLAALWLYFAPTQIARRRGHHSWRAILALDLLLGWTGFGWLAALIWSLSGPSAAERLELGRHEGRVDRVHAGDQVV